VSAVFASAGIAGFAVAMAAKDTLSNLFGGVAIFMDRPFRPGDYIVLDNDERVKWCRSACEVRASRPETTS
jgi:MscS family membrane protein